MGLLEAIRRGPPGLNTAARDTNATNMQDERVPVPRGRVVGHTYDEFRMMLIARHEHPMTSALSTVADALWLAAIPAGLITRDFRVLLGAFLGGSAVATFAHVFQPGTVKDELAAVVMHPMWAARAEAERVRSGVIAWRRSAIGTGRRSRFLLGVTRFGSGDWVRTARVRTR